MSVSLPPITSSGGLVGREADLAVVLTFLDDAAVHGGALLLSGEPGIGKTVLLDEAEATASAAGSRVLRAAGVEFLTDLSFSTLTALLQPVSSRIDELDAGHRDAVAGMLGLAATPVTDQLLGYNAVLKLLGLVAAERPLLVIVDDIHWADRASAALLGFVARRLRGSRIGLLASFRTGIEGVLGRTGLPQHDLAPLDDRHAATLLATRYPLLGPRATRRVLAEAQGNPLALLELPMALGAMRHRESIPMTSTVLPLSRRLHALYSTRIEELPPVTHRLLLLAALEGTGDLGTVMSAARGDGALSDLAPAERGELVTVDSGVRRLAFRHPVVRATVVEVATAGERLSAHRALAEALSDDPVRHARHLAAASTDPDEHVAALLEQAAGLVLRRGDAVGAFTNLLYAADLSPAPGTRSRRLTEAAYIGAQVAGELRVSAQLLVEARRADPAVRDSLRAAAAASYLLMNGEGDVTTAHRLLVGALQAARTLPGEDDAARVAALYGLFRISTYGSRPELWDSFLEVLSGFSGAVPPVLHLLVTVLGDPVGVSEREVRAVESAIQGLRDESDPMQIERVGTLATYLDRVPGCREALWRLVDNGRADGAIASSVSAMIILCFDAAGTGRWAESDELAEEGLALCAANGYQLQRWPFRSLQAMVAAGRGDQETVDAVVREIDEWAAPRGVNSLRILARHATAIAALGRGDAEQAYAELTAVCRPGEVPVGVVGPMWMVMDLVEAATDSGHDAEAAAHVVAMQRAGITSCVPRLALLTAGAAAISAPDGAAAGLFEHALSLPGLEYWPFDTARIHLRYGEYLHRTQDGAAAREHLSVALTTFRRLGAGPWMARAALSLRAAGAAVRGAPVVASLSAPELEIATLAASGLTNKQIGQRLFLSHRTVGARLHRIYPKLGITSRAALRDALAAMKVDGAPPHD